MNLLDRNNNIAILIAGIISLCIGVGIARFAFTSLLPYMLDDFLTLTLTGVMASINFVGYLSGAIFSVFLKDLNQKIFYFRIGIILCVLTTFVLGISENTIIWFISRIIAGFGAAMALIVGSSIVMMKLSYKNKTKAMGIHFSGLGISILSTDLISKFVIYLDGTWQMAWLILAFLGIFFASYSLFILSIDKDKKQTVIKHKFDKSIFSFFIVIVILSYFTQGVGFVVQGTFLPDIINSIKGLEGFGTYTWTIVGIFAIPSSILLMRLAHKYGSINTIIFAMLLQIVGILISTVTSNMYLNLFSGILYGSTFAGLVSLFMHLGGKLAPHNPVILMASFTTAYGIGQVFAPLYSVALVNYSGNYDLALYLTAFIVFIGVLLLFFNKNKYKN